MTKKYFQGLFSAFVLFLILAGSAQAISVLKVKTNTPFVFVSVPTDVNITVTDLLSGAPINGATVSLNGAGFTGSDTTGADGTVVVSVHATSGSSLFGFASIIVTASNPGFINGSASILVLQRQLIVNANPKNIVSGTPTGITINVTTPNFTTQTFEPVSDVNVSLTGDGVNETGLTLADGTVVITVNPVGPGTINITANKTNFLNGTGTILVDPLIINATPASVLVSTPVDIKFNITDATGAPVDGADITLTGAGVSGSNTTDADGIAIINVHATQAGTISVTASKTGFLNGTASITATVPPLLVAAIPVVVKVSAPTNVIFFVSTPNITTGLTNPVPNANVNLSGAGVVNASNITDANGTTVISVHALTAGRITVTANKTNFTNGTTFLLAMADRLFVTANPMLGSVSVPKNVIFTVTSNGIPQANASVNLSQRGVEIANGITDASGKVNINVHATSPGLINVVANKTFFINGTTIMMATQPFGAFMRLTANPTSVKVNVETDVTFKATDLITGMPVAGANVNLTKFGVPGEIGSNTTDASGQAVIKVNVTTTGLIKAVSSKVGYNNGNAFVLAQI